MKYKCTNKLCSEYGKEKFEMKTRISVKNGKVIDEASICPFCGKIREHTDVNTDYTNIRPMGHNIIKS